MNTMNNAQAQELTSAIISLTAAVNELIDLAKAEETEAASTTATETTATTTTDAEATETTTVGYLPCPPEATEFKGSMIEEEPMDPIPTYEENAAEANADTAEAEETAGEEYLDNILRDISVLYDIAEYALDHEGYNISSDHSPYAPKDNKVGSIDDRYRVFISKEVISSSSETTGTFRLIVNEKTTGIEIMSSEMKIINDHIKVYSSENTSRLDKLKEGKKIMRFLEIVDETTSLVMSKYISK